MAKVGCTGGGKLAGKVEVWCGRKWLLLNWYKGFTISFRPNVLLFAAKLVKSGAMLNPLLAGSWFANKSGCIYDRRSCPPPWWTEDEAVVICGMGGARSIFWVVVTMEFEFGWLWLNACCISRRIKSVIEDERTVGSMVIDVLTLRLWFVVISGAGDVPDVGEVISTVSLVSAKLVKWL